MTRLLSGAPLDEGASAVLWSHAEACFASDSVQGRSSAYALDSAVPPTRVLAAQPRYQIDDLRVRRRPQSVRALTQGSPLSAHELAMPPQGPDDCLHATAVGVPAVAAPASDAAGPELQLGALPAPDRERSAGRPEAGRSSTAPDLASRALSGKGLREALFSTDSARLPELLRDHDAFGPTSVAQGIGRLPDRDSTCLPDLRSSLRLD